MNERRLTELLREVTVPAAAEAEERGLRVARGAFAQRQQARRPALPRLAAAMAAATVLAALLLSPAGAAVRDWVGDVLTPGVRDAEPALTDVPGGGRLLVASPPGEWVVQPDGSRRLIGSYREATWSPHGLYVAAVSGHALSAVEPDGTTRWALSVAAPPRDPRWSPSGFRIAYRAGRVLRVVAGDGSGDRAIDRRVAPVAPAWAPDGRHLLAYLDAGHRLRLVDVDAERTVGTAAASPQARGLAWSPDGGTLLELTGRAAILRELRASRSTGRIGIGSPRRLPLPAAATVEEAAFSPDGATVAAVASLPHRAEGGPRSELLLLDRDGGASRPLFQAPGRLADLTWSPDGRRLLIAWPEADQWLFIPASGRGSVSAVAGVSSQFSPGAAAGTAGFPRIEGWCCTAATASAP